jgi:PAP2 superfamily
MASFAYTLAVAKARVGEFPRAWRLHAFMFVCCAFLGIVCVAWRHAFCVLDWQHAIVADGVLTPLFLLPAIFWHERGRFPERDAALTLPWILVLQTLFFWVPVLSASLAMPLCDRLYLSLDRSLGINVAAVVAWTARHAALGVALNYSYHALFPALLATAILLPPLAGQIVAAERFLLSAAISFLLSLPIFTLLPAIGPWVTYGFAPSALEQKVTLSILALRDRRPPIHPGIVCFPSFHVIWCVLAAAALWPLRPLRIPTTIAATLIVASTITTGWHYGCDVISGLGIAAASLFLAETVRRRYLGNVDPAVKRELQTRVNQPGIAS